MSNHAEPSIAELLGRKQGNRRSKRRTKGTTSQRATETVAEATNEQNLTEDFSGTGAKVSMFDESVENHFRAMDKISELCGEAEEGALDENEIQRLSSSITFLRYTNSIAFCVIFLSLYCSFTPSRIMSVFTL